jgi:uncharacterized protein (TIGR02452 family)
MIIKNKHNYDKTHKYSNADNIEVYKDTLLKATQYPIGNTTLWDSTNSSDDKFWSKDKKGEVVVENVDTVGALVQYAPFSRVGVLNMASFSTPGGGVAYGAKAQEEALFRCSNLGLSISSEFYPLKEDQALLTTGAVFFKDREYRDLPHGYVADVITCPAVKIIEGNYPAGYEKIVETKMNVILDLAAREGVKTLILGAWGCGVYGNNPNEIASLFREVLLEDDRRFCFQRIVFAIINDENSQENNYMVFKSIIEDGTFKI